MVGFLYQNYDTIYIRFFPTYTCVLSCFGVFFIPKYMTSFLQTRLYMRTKNPYIYVLQMGSQESRRIRGTELYRQQKTPSCTMELKHNFSLNQAWPQYRARFGSYSLPSPDSSGGCLLLDNGFVGIRGLSLQRLCTLFHKCWPKHDRIS